MYLKSLSSKFPIKVRLGDTIKVGLKYFIITSINEKTQTGTAENSRTFIKFTKSNAKFKRRNPK